MAKRYFLFIIISALFVLRCYSQVTSPDSKLRTIISQEGQANVTVQYSDQKSFEILTKNVSVLSVKNRIIYISLSPLTVGWFIRQKYDYLIVEKSYPRAAFSAGNINKVMQWENYPTYAQYDSIMKSFTANYPSLCRLDTIGKSVNGKLVLALKISKNAMVDEDEPEVFYTSSMHGDETGGYILMLHLADYLLKNYPSDGRVKSILDNLEVWINPLANPDGTYGNGNAITSPVRYNANGYDLNRNFPDPITPNTIKQKETLDMIKFMRKHRFVLSANFHSGTEVVNYPWDRWLTKLHADDSWFHSISRAYADTAHKYGGPAYMNFLDNGVTRGAVWYIVYGGRQDFVTWELHGREVTIELDDQYVTPAAQLNLLWQNNWHSLLGYIENALYGIHGSVHDKYSHIPLPAKVFIKGYDKDSSQVYSDTLTGSFVRFLNPGKWNLTFTSAGYEPLVINDVLVTSMQKTDLVVDMIPVTDSVESPVSLTGILFYPNPARNVINALVPDTIAGRVNVRIINQAGMLISDYNTEADMGIPLIIDVRSLSAGLYTCIFTNLMSGTSFNGRFVVVK
jgi:hypothetical protein